MKYGIIADVHANLDALNLVIEKEEKKTGLHWISLGDIVGYGPDPVGSLQVVKEKTLPSFNRVGNHDAILKGLWRPLVEEEAEFTLRRHRQEIMQSHPDLWSWCKTAWDMAHVSAKRLPFRTMDCWLVHGSPANSHRYHCLRTYLYPGVDREGEDHKGDTFDFLRKGARPGFPSLLIHGHSHVPYGLGRKRGQTRFEYLPINYSNPIDLKPYELVILSPGSVGQPRNPDRFTHAAYGVLDTKECNFQFRRAVYDIVQIKPKLSRLGYPIILGNILSGYHETNPVWMEGKDEAAMTPREKVEGFGKLHWYLTEWQKYYRECEYGWEPINSQ
jgi:hypothetical protein